ncbi:hypothetical protein [Corynebacterium rouxii]
MRREAEFGLFALQAALGAGLLGYALGFYRGRKDDAAVQDQAADHITTQV